MSAKPEEIFADLVKQLPTEVDEGFIFTPENLPQLPKELETDRLVIKLGGTEYHSYTTNYVDSLWCYADREYWRNIGLLFLSKVFHSQPSEVVLKLTHPESELKKFILDYSKDEYSWQIVSGYYTQPEKYDYRVGTIESEFIVPGEVSSTWQSITKEFQYLPLFGINDEVKHRDKRIVRCAGSEFGNILMAKLLLDAGGSGNRYSEVNLEGEHGNSGVGLGSAEFRLFFPESHAWQAIFGNAQEIPAPDIE